MVILQHLEFLNLGNVLIQVLWVIELELALLDKLKTSDGCEQFSAAGDPKDRVEIHGLVTIQALMPRGIGSDSFTIPVNCSKNNARHLLFVFCDAI